MKRWGCWMTIFGGDTARKIAWEVSLPDRRGCLCGRQVPGAQLSLETFLMKLLLFVIGWCILFVLAWPLALVVLVLAPFIWLLSLPFRLVGITFDALFALIRGLLFLPARMLGYRG